MGSHRTHVEAERASERAAVALHETVLIQEELVEEAEIEAQEAREDALDERQAAHDAAAELEAEKYQNMLLARQVARAKFKASQLEMQVKEMSPVAHGCSADEWVSLCAAAQRKRAWRDRHALRAFLQSHPWRAEDLAVVLDELGLLLLLFNTKEGWRIYFGKVHRLHLKLEREDFRNQVWPVPSLRDEAHPDKDSKVGRGWLQGVQCRHRSLQEEAVACQPVQHEREADDTTHLPGAD